LEVVFREQLVSCIDPAPGGSELVGKKLDENDVGKLLSLCGTSPILLIPLPQNLVKPRGQRLVVQYISRAYSRETSKGLAIIRKILPNEHVWIELRRVDFLGKV
jgi:hypothetical protein